MPLKERVSLLARKMGYELKRWRNPTQAQIDRDNALLSVAAFFKRHKSPVKTVFDVGANYGEYCAEAAGLFPDAKILCFEPTPDVLPRLRERFAGNARVQIVPMAISNTEAKLKFHVRPDAAWNSLLANADHGQITPQESAAIEVQATTLDTFARQNGIDQIDLLKLDIQGAEMLALQGAGGLLSAGKIGAVQLEINFAGLYEGQASFEPLSRMMFDHGYWLEGIYQVATSSGLTMSADIVFAHERFS